MNFDLLNDWDKIKEVRHSFNWFKERWLYKWGSNSVNASVMYEALKLIQPRVAIETGTFEGHGVFIIAKALSDVNKDCRIYTIDFDDDPLTKLSKKNWLKLKNIREENLTWIKKQFSNVEIVYIEGDSRIVLPELVSRKSFKWDFFYQDSMHFYDGIKSEWDVIYKFANNKAVAVFDDISLSKKEFNQDGYRFCNEFILKTENTDNWNFISTEIGHHQFWIQKRK